MLQPMLPLSVVPVTSQLDPAKRMPDIPPVAPVQQSSNETSIDLHNEDTERSALLLREEQQRQQQQHQGRPYEEAEEYQGLVVPGDSLNADNTVPVVPLIDDEPRQGVWVDIQI
ncbi:aspartate-semialdehyde dehydrogenase [Pseudomonas syringae pv. actinidiae]|uniref:aspartate-semialdehyde dehydrogenase n=1 Tax=Pseudomonas syringae TaxID=317 RepID=UPI000BB557AA|nr:aspartate-semialdehyde dehydrogenase [Pseudomonas syringae]PBK51263.1 aspartate-semialdehyde dehydrogenase [Pseudomonas syringae pv. actinidiae]PBK51523.1 aspartate-semialdehyde dehydrogenase [Pseudomonas syringae pv. actinidiae]RJX58230.1 aspartate-semialdehyde dehydrogenase [Pseudomonas syringae pv. actinidiae]RJX59146.1 aspartate-semialdehyde dehydrogenase [Pseudomonas syringae pv. actinidiae]RJX63286.1 aspartate-semialdehyde dehydrogenase [Pseudomonas syringae pv. actinidiae]